MKREVITMKKRGFCFLIVLVILCSLGCDTKGNLSQEVTKDLYQDLKEVFSNAEIWRGSITVDRPFEIEPATISFVRKAMELWNRDNADPSVSGYWFDSKTYCKVCTLDCDETIEMGGKAYFIDEISIVKYRHGEYQIWITYQYELDSQDSNIVEITLT